MKFKLAHAVIAALAAAVAAPALAQDAKPDDGASATEIVVTASRREERLQTFRRALVNIGAQIESMRQMLHERKDKAPHHVLDKQERAIDRMNHFYQANIARLDEAHRALEDFRTQVKQKVFEWEFAKAGQDVMAALNPSEMQDLVQDLLSDEALRSVQNRFNLGDRGEFTSD